MNQRARQPATQRTKPRAKPSALQIRSPMSAPANVAGIEGSRRTAATWAIAAGMSMSAAAEHVTNHETLTVFASYVELTRDDEVHPQFD